MRARARTALIGVVLLLLVFLLATRLGEEDRAAPREGSNKEAAAELPSDPPIDGERRSLVPDWKPSDLGEASKEELAAAPKRPAEDPAEIDRRPVELGDEEPEEEELRDAIGDRGFGEGRIEGRVTYSGAIPEPEILDMSKDPKCAQGTIASIEDRTLRKIVVGDQGGLANAVVWVEVDPQLAYPVSEKPVELHQRGCRFDPETIAIQIAQPFVVFNDDPLLHNVHAIAKRSEFNQAMPKQGMKIEKKFKAKDLDGMLTCEVHPWMKGRLYVFDHPFFAVTRPSGKFLIEHLPGKGPYRLFVQHPHAGTKELAVQSGTVEVHFADAAL